MDSFVRFKLFRSLQINSTDLLTTFNWLSLSLIHLVCRSNAIFSWNKNMLFISCKDKFRAKKSRKLFCVTSNQHIQSRLNMSYMRLFLFYGPDALLLGKLDVKRRIHLIWHLVKYRLEQAITYAQQKLVQFNKSAILYMLKQRERHTSSFFTFSAPFFFRPCRMVVNSIDSNITVKNIQNRASHLTCNNIFSRKKTATTIAKKTKKPGISSK